jgi:hypothetical protein
MFSVFIINPVLFLFLWQDQDSAARKADNRYNPNVALQTPYRPHQVPVHSWGKNGHICRTLCTIPGLSHALLTLVLPLNFLLIFFA